MEFLREWGEVIRSGGWSGLLMAGFAFIAVIAILGSMSSRWFWIALAALAAVFGLYYVVFLI